MQATRCWAPAAYVPVPQGAHAPLPPWSLYSPGGHSRTFCRGTQPAVPAARRWDTEQSAQLLPAYPSLHVQLPRLLTTPSPEQSAAFVNSVHVSPVPVSGLSHSQKP